MSRVGETGVGEMGIGEKGVGEMGVGETGPNCALILSNFTMIMKGQPHYNTIFGVHRSSEPCNNEVVLTCTQNQCF